MTAIPEPIHNIANLIDEHHASQPDEPRGHLGCSLLGHPCERWLWLSFRWAVKEKFQGRILRLFRRGNNEENIIISDLEAIGVNNTLTLGRMSAGPLTALSRAASLARRKRDTLRSLKLMQRNHLTTL